MSDREHGMAFFKQTQSPPLSVPASYVHDRAEQIIRPTHSEVEEEDFGRERDVDEDEEVDEVSTVRVRTQTTSVDDPLELMDRSGRCSIRGFLSVNELEWD